MKYCKKCLYPNTKPQLQFDERGICSACNNYKLKDEVDWGKKKEDLLLILEKYRSKEWIVIMIV